MRIGVMLRSLDEKGGIGVYTKGIVEELLAQDERNEYVFLYRSAANLGRYDRANVKEVVVPAPHQTWWDQVSIPPACRREKIDVLFHPKFTVPLLAPCPSVMVVHGADWFIPEHARFYKSHDVLQIKVLMPQYFRHAAAVISVTEITTRNFQRILNLPNGKIHTVYLAPARHFEPITDRTILARVREKYELPERFILTLSKPGGGGRKNIDGILESFRLLHGRTSHKLVVGGQGCEIFRTTYDVPDHGFGEDVLFPGWIDQADLPAVYSLADLYLYPSRLESAAIPLMEAMACGTPIVTSSANDLEDVAGGAALLVDPENPQEIAGAALRVLDDEDLQADLRRRGLARAAEFSWERCGRETLSIIEGAAEHRARRK